MFSKVKARVGLDRVRIMITGSAPIAAHVMDFLRIVFRWVYTSITECLMGRCGSHS